jgi:O-antigen ligase
MPGIQSQSTGDVLGDAAVCPKQNAEEFSPSILQSSRLPGVSRQISLIALWLGSLLFIYQELDPWLNINLGVRLSPDRVLFVILGVLFFKTTPQGRSGGKVGRLMAVFAALCTISWLLTRPDAEEAKLRWLTTLFQIAYFPFCIYYIARNSRFTDQDLGRLFKGIAIIQTYLVLNGLAEHFEFTSLVWPHYILNEELNDQWERLSGPFCNSGMFGAALVMNFGCLSVMTLYSRGVRRLYLYALLLLSCACIYWTSTRTVWIGFFVLLVVFNFSGTGLKHIARKLAICVLLVGLTGVAGKFSAFKTSLFFQRQNTIDYRLANLQVGMKAFSENPVLGIGYGSFEKRLSEFEGNVGDPDGDRGHMTAGNENTWLGILVELGLVGLSLYVAIYLLLIKGCLGVLRFDKNEASLSRPLAALGLAMILYMMSNWNTGDLRFHVYEPNLAFFVLGVVMGRREGTVEE